MPSSDVVRRLGTARAAQQDIDRLIPKQKLPPREVRTIEERFSEVVDDPDLLKATQKLFADGSYRLAVLDGCICLDQFVKTKSGITSSGADLMRTALSPKNPRLRLSSLKTQSQKDQQLGYMDMLAGCMTGIRNPRAHEHMYLDEPHIALELLGLLNHFMRTVRASKRTRKTSKKATTP